MIGSPRGRHGFPRRYEGPPSEAEPGRRPGGRRPAGRTGGAGRRPRRSGIAPHPRGDRLSHLRRFVRAQRRDGQVQLSPGTQTWIAPSNAMHQLDLSRCQRGPGWRGSGGQLRSGGTVNQVPTVTRRAEPAPILVGQQGSSDDTAGGAGGARGGGTGGAGAGGGGGSTQIFTQAGALLVAASGGGGGGGRRRRRGPEEQVSGKVDRKRAPRWRGQRRRRGDIVGTRRVGRGERPGRAEARPRPPPHRRPGGPVTHRPAAAAAVATSPAAAAAPTAAVAAARGSATPPSRSRRPTSRATGWGTGTSPSSTRPPLLSRPAAEVGAGRSILPRATATGSAPRTVASSASGAPCSTARRVPPGSTSPSWAWPPPAAGRQRLLAGGLRRRHLRLR